jgi:hypothetical protein
MSDSLLLFDMVGLVVKNCLGKRLIVIFAVAASQ